MSEKLENGQVGAQPHRRVLPWVLAFLPLIALSALLFQGETETGLESHSPVVSVGDERAGVYRPAIPRQEVQAPYEPPAETETAIEEAPPEPPPAAEETTPSAPAEEAPSDLPQEELPIPPSD